MAMPLPPTAYRMHVSQRYLDLTKQKLDLIRLPRDPQSTQPMWDAGVSKPHLESVIDHWIESYRWREQETFYNDALPQFRVAINRTRLHFVHKRSDVSTATPLLFITSWPESFLTVTPVIDALCNPGSNPALEGSDTPSFHVVAPSIPGFGFSDTVVEESNNMSATADIFDKLMQHLGYKRYIVHGVGWAFKICRILALNYDGCIAVHTVNPEIPSPNYAYSHSPLTSPVVTSPPSTPAILTPPLLRPQTVSYGLTDSPAGLLAYILDSIRPPVAPGSVTQSPGVFHLPSTPATERSSPRSMTAASTPTATPSGETSPQSSRSSELSRSANPWSPTNLITWTMMYWLPGPEVSLRWLANSTAFEGTLWRTTSSVPLGITHYHDTTTPGVASTTQMQCQWAEMYHRVALMRQREGKIRSAVWERPGDVIDDLRELVSITIGPLTNPHQHQQQHRQWQQQQQQQSNANMAPHHPSNVTVTGEMTWQR